MDRAEKTTGFVPESVPSPRLGAYLRRLREGYGYTLRKVEERASALGETIDNSQLSRFEKGKAVPSFDKLRALARIFNVSVQHFSDVLDLEEYEAFKPSADDFGDLVRAGNDMKTRGEHGRAFVTYERALEVAASDSDPARALERATEARWRMATALKAMGKLSMAEHEIRGILKGAASLHPRHRIRSLLQLSYLYRDFGDLYLASVLARECLVLADQDEDLSTRAGVRNTLGNIRFAERDFEGALGHYRAALEILDALGGFRELRVTLLTNLGGCYVSTGRFDEGVELLRKAHARASEHGFRRVAALSLTRLGEAYLQAEAPDHAESHFADSDYLASRPSEPYHDILFLNAFRRWEIACEADNATREKISFGRLRHLRSLVQRRFPEVDEFDRYVEQTRRQHA